MKTNILNKNGEKAKQIDLPKCFSGVVREDIVNKVLEAKKVKQAYGSKFGAGMEYSASGKWNHRRHVWKSQYGRGWSRIPRKIFSRRGTQFRTEGATVPNTKGGRRAHPPKAFSMLLNFKKINKKEMKIAFISALSATANNHFIENKYFRIKKIEKNVPFIVEGEFLNLKTKELLSSLNKILGKNLFEVAIKKKKVRAGIGKLRGRKYKSNAGMLMVIGNKEKLKVSGFDVVKVRELGVSDLAKGGVGRLTVYSEQAIKEIEDKLNSSPKKNKEIKEKTK